MSWPWSKKTKSEQGDTGEEGFGQVSVGGIDVVLDRHQSNAFETVSARIEERMQVIMDTGRQKATALRQEIADAVLKEAERLDELAARPTDASEILEAVEALKRFQAERRAICEKRETAINTALEEAMGAIGRANDQAAEQLAGLRGKVLEEIRQPLQKVRERLDQDIDARNRQLVEQVESLVQTIEDSGAETFRAVVDTSRDGLERIAADYGAQVSLLFNALTRDRVQRIRQASGIQEFNIHQPKEAAAPEPDEVDAKPPPEQEPS